MEIDLKHGYPGATATKPDAEIGVTDLNQAQFPSRPNLGNKVVVAMLSSVLGLGELTLNSGCGINLNTSPATTDTLSVYKTNNANKSASSTVKEDADKVQIVAKPDADAAQVPIPGPRLVPCTHKLINIAGTIERETRFDLPADWFTPAADGSPSISIMIGRVLHPNSLPLGANEWDRRVNLITNLQKQFVPVGDQTSFANGLKALISQDQNKDTVSS